MSDEKPPFDVNARIMKLMRSLMRHRERYIRAWMAHYGVHPAQAQMVTHIRMDGGEIMRIEYRRDTDDVAELVKAANDLIDSWGTRDFVEGSEMHALVVALKPFARQP